MDNNPGNKKILIVEDEPQMLEALVDEFKGAGFSVLTAKNGEEGLKTAMENHPDLIVLDIIMPKMDGMTALRELKKNSWGALVPIIILTNINEPDKLAEALEIGVSEYIVKAETSLNDICDTTKKILGMV